MKRCKQLVEASLYLGLDEFPFIEGEELRVKHRLPVRTSKFPRAFDLSIRQGSRFHFLAETFSTRRLGRMLGFSDFGSHEIEQSGARQLLAQRVGVPWCVGGLLRLCQQLEVKVVALVDH